MGAAQSIPSEIEGVHFSNTHPPRNKLTKPRTNSNTTSREASCLPPSLSRLSLSGGPRPLTVQYQTTEESHAGIIAVEYSKTLPSNDVRKSGMWSFVGDHEFEAYSESAVDSALPGVVSIMPVSTGMRRKGSMVTRSSTNSSAACAPPPNRNSEIPSMGTVRRRSQLLAAPPATATRKPVQPYLQDQFLPDTPSPDSYTFLPPSMGYDSDRCTTPSGYSVLGAFKRGSLRIANGAASPAPSSSRASPGVPMETEYFGSNIALPDDLISRPPSRDKPLFVVTNSTLPTREVRLVPPSPTNERDRDEYEIPNSPFSFTRSPSVHSEDIDDSPFEFEPPASDTPDSLRQSLFRPTPSYESLSSTASSAISAGYEYHKILSEQCLNQRFDKPVRVDVKIINEIGGESMDSGYSSSGSVNSWKTAWSHQHAKSKSTARKSEVLMTTKDNPGFSEEVLMKPEQPVSRRRSVVAAIRRRYSQGDLKAFARNNNIIKQPPVPPIPVVERSKSLWKPRPELKHRRSMITFIKSSVPQFEVPKTSPDIQPVPPLPQHAKMERKGAFNLLTVEDYLPLVEQIPFTSNNDRNTGAAGLAFTSPASNMHDSIMRISIGPELCRGSRITGQEYYQRFSRQQSTGVRAMVS
ncbi:hypothetical protein DFP73DRAFT_485472 [Morchella snyderi]|nr:hypothetical protein DFP73DRAFT_485472 [Morchella snyderi]